MIKGSCDSEYIYSINACFYLSQTTGIQLEQWPNKTCVARGASKKMTSKPGTYHKKDLNHWPVYSLLYSHRFFLFSAFFFTCTFFVEEVYKTWQTELVVVIYVILKGYCFSHTYSHNVHYVFMLLTKCDIIADYLFTINFKWIFSCIILNVSRLISPFRCH